MSEYDPTEYVDKVVKDSEEFVEKQLMKFKKEQISLKSVVRGIQETVSCLQTELISLKQTVVEKDQEINTLQQKMIEKDAEVQSLKTKPMEFENKLRSCLQTALDTFNPAHVNPNVLAPNQYMASYDPSVYEGLFATSSTIMQHTVPTVTQKEPTVTQQPTVPSIPDEHGPSPKRIKTESTSQIIDKLELLPEGDMEKLRPYFNAYRSKLENKEMLNPVQKAFVNYKIEEMFGKDPKPHVTTHLARDIIREGVNMRVWLEDWKPPGTKDDFIGYLMTKIKNDRKKQAAKAKHMKRSQQYAILDQKLHGTILEDISD